EEPPMTADVYRYAFVAEVPIEEAEATVALAILAAEALHGEALVRLEAGHAFDPDKRCCVIDGSTPVGRDLNKLFCGFLRPELGEDACAVERVVQATGLAGAPAA